MIVRSIGASSALVLLGGDRRLYSPRPISWSMKTWRAPYVYIAGVVVVGIFGYLISTIERGERAGVYRSARSPPCRPYSTSIFYQQMSTLLNLFVLRNVGIPGIRRVRPAPVGLVTGTVSGVQPDLDLYPEPHSGLGLHCCRPC